jgi:pentatricopeptide repeat protein
MVVERKNLNQSLLISKYQRDFEREPRSRVFAPLAEAYRKSGMVDKALDVLKVGMRYNPDYVLGYLGLALCYIDINQFNLAYTTLRPLINGNRDNIRLLRVFAELCEKLENIDEALETYKYLLFVNPRDAETAAKVKNYESKTATTLRTSFVEKEDTVDKDLFKVDELDSYDGWTQVNLESQEIPKTLPKEEKIQVEDLEDWKVQNISEEVQEPISLKAVEVIPEEDSSEREFVVAESDDEEDEIEESPAQKYDSPIITHTLVDLYCQQGHIQKAIEILDKILELNPNDQATLSKKEEVYSLWKATRFEAEEVIEAPQVFEEEQVEDEEIEGDGHDRLSQLLDKKLKHAPIEDEIEPEVAELTTNKSSEIESKLLQFLNEIYKRRDEIHSAKS